MLNIIYRLCENETDGNIRDIRPKWFNKTKCLKSFIDSVEYAKDHVAKVVFVHDGPEGPLLDYLNTHTMPFDHEIVKVHFKDNLGSLLTTLDIADNLDENDDIYFIEDDYLHKTDAVKNIALSVSKFGLMTGYDHLYRYIPTNPPDADYPLKVVFDTDSNIHWRTTESTCCTWAATYETYKNIRDDARHFGLWDCGFFVHLHRRGIHLWSAIPGITTQVDCYMSPGVDWEKINENVVV